MGLTFRPGSRRLLSTLAPGPKRRIKAALQIIDADPHDSRMDLKVLAHEPRRYVRCRVGDYRIVFSQGSDGTTIERIFHRRDGYGWLERL